MSDRSLTPSPPALDVTRARGAATPVVTLRVATPRAPDSLGRLQRAAGNQAMHRLLRSAGIQPKLTINPPDDEYEREADRVADEVMRMPLSTPGVGQRAPIVQRKCAACAAEDHDDHIHRKCAECEAEEKDEAHGHVQAKRIEGLAIQRQRLGIHRARESTQRQCAACEAEGHESGDDGDGSGVLRTDRDGAEVPAVSAGLESYLSGTRGGGSPLAPVTRAFFEPRFGEDFQRVRIHSDAAAARAAAAINARAFTRGSDIYFGPGQFRPGSHAGDRLLGHELTHVVQQGRGGGIAPQILSRDWNECGSREDCPPRKAGEEERAAKATLQVGAITAPEVGTIVSNFPIGSSRATSLAKDSVWMTLIAQITAEDGTWEILGFSDCQGEDQDNTKLRKRRAEAVRDTLPLAARKKIVKADGAPLADCVASNDKESNRAFNRSVVVRRLTTNIVFPDAPIEGKVPKFVCGPNVTNEVIAALSSIASAFAGWTADEKGDACDALDSYSTGAMAWDIVELHNNAWIYRQYRPTCASAGATPACGSTIQVGAECHYAGSVNYVIFGKMCKLCYDHYLAIPLINTGAARFTRKEMLSLIKLYKGGGITGLGSPSGNFAESMKWAEAGYDDWPSGGKTPAGDRNNCTPMCPTKYTGPAFRVNWHPKQFFTGS